MKDVPFTHDLSFLDKGLKSTEKSLVIPFTHELCDEGNVCSQTRLKKYIDFIPKLSPHVLDISPPNWISEQIGKHYKVKIFNTKSCDFNKEICAPHKTYNTILCFEVLEHTMNPLLFMENIRDKLSPHGVVYLSTPLSRLIGIYCTDQHFVEYKKQPLVRMFEWAGFRVEDYTTIRVFPSWFYITGFRPLLRFFTMKTQLFKLRKI